MSASRDELDASVGELYGCLRELAEKRLARERPGHTLQPTALVHEAWLRLADAGPESWPDKARFVAACAQTLRRVLVDHARAHRAQKRGEGQARVTLVEIEAEQAPDQLDVLDLDEALERLESEHARTARVVELRFFGGLTVEECARCLSVSKRTVESDWQFARAWLIRALGAER